MQGTSPGTMSLHMSRGLPAVQSAWRKGYCASNASCPENGVMVQLKVRERRGSHADRLGHDQGICFRRFRRWRQRSKEKTTRLTSMSRTLSWECHSEKLPPAQHGESLPYEVPMASISCSTASSKASACRRALSTGVGPASAPSRRTLRSVWRGASGVPALWLNPQARQQLEVERNRLGARLKTEVPVPAREE